MPYAENTSVPVERSRAELEATLARYGADAFMYGWDQEGAVIQFRAHGRHVKFELPLPARDDQEFTEHSRGMRTAEAALKAWEQACRQRWRALNLVVKAKLEAVETGITVFEDEFLAHIILPNGQTAGQWMRPQVAKAYEDGTMPKDLPMQLTTGRAKK